MSLLLITIFSNNLNAQTWDEWFRQKKTQRKYLLEQIAKLQLYLQYLKKGYNILQTGLTTISEIKHGDFNLHSLYFASLQNVNPAIKNYSKVADIILMQIKMVSEYKSTFKQIQNINLFSQTELDFIESIFTNILTETTKDLDAVDAVITAGSLELKDDERIHRIDALYNNVDNEFETLFSFCAELKSNASLRSHELHDAQTIQDLYGFH